MLETWVKTGGACPHNAANGTTLMDTPHGPHFSSHDGAFLSVWAQFGPYTYRCGLAGHPPIFEWITGNALFPVLLGTGVVMVHAWEA